MARRHWIGTVAVGVAAALVGPTPSSGQTVRGTVIDGSNDRPVPIAGIYLLDRDREAVSVAMADSLGRYVLSVPESGEYFLVAQRFGYQDMESPLLAISDSDDYTLELELRPEPLGLGKVTVTVRNEEAIDWLKRELGTNPAALFGFRLLQGDRLTEAKVRARFKPTETLRWLYIPVSHGLECVAINSFPRAASVGYRGPRRSALGSPGSAPSGTVSMGRLRDEFERRPRCGSLMVDDRTVPNEQIESIDMSSIAVVVTLPGMVRMYTYDFDWSFRQE